MVQVERRMAVMIAVVVVAGAASATERITIPPGTRVWFVDHNAAPAGDGGRAAPFDVLAMAEDASAPGDAIVVLPGDGSDRGYNDGIRLKERQRLLGLGVEVALADGTVLPAAGAPVISNLAGAGVALASGTVVAGVAVGGTTGDGIAGERVADVSLRAVRVTAAGAGGIALRHCTGAITIEHAFVEGAGGNGISLLISEGAAEVTVREVTVEDAQKGDGLVLLVEGSGSAGLRVESAICRRNRLAGVRALADGEGRVRVEISASAFAGGNTGIELATEGAGMLSFAVHDNRSFSEIAASIVTIAQGDGTSASSSLSGTIARNSAMSKTPGSGHGIWVNAGGAGTLTALLDGNTIAGGIRLDHAILAEAIGGALNLAIVNNTATVEPTAGAAVLVRAAGRATVCAEITGNTARGGEQQEGIRIEQDGGDDGAAVVAVAGFAGGVAGPRAVEHALAVRNPGAGRVAALAVTSFAAAPRDGCPLPAIPSS